MTWEEAWEIHKDAAAEAAHIRWMQTKQAHGFANHPWPMCGPGLKYVARECWNNRDETGRQIPCNLPQDKHHSDMIPFAELSDEIKAYDYETAIIGFKFGFEAGVASVARPC